VRRLAVGEVSAPVWCALAGLHLRLRLARARPAPGRTV